MPRKVQILGARQLNQLVERLASRILRRVRGTKGIVLIGIKTRGEFLAQRIAGLLSKKLKVEVGTVDIRLYRDDLNVLQRDLLIGKSDIPFDLNDKIVVLVDDVLFTGRTVRAALDQIVDLGRPAIVHLAVLLDRGHREFPICSTFCGKKVRTEKGDRVEVRLKEKDARDEAYVIRE
mgnify:CR=1 FL=1